MYCSKSQHKYNVFVTLSIFQKIGVDIIMNIFFFWNVIHEIHHTTKQIRIAFVYYIFKWLINTPHKLSVKDGEFRYAFITNLISMIFL